MLGNWRPRLLNAPARRADALLATMVAAAMAFTVSAASEPEAARSPDPLAYLLGIAVGALLLARRRFPLAVLIGSVGVLFVYYGLDYPAFSPAVPLAVAAYSAVVAGHVIATSLLLTGIVLFGVGWQTLGENADLASVIGANTLADAALLSAVVLLGEAVRNRRAWAEEVRLRLERAEADREQEAARRIEQERLRIAGELHDVLAHTLAVITVHAAAAAEVVPAEAQTSLGAIRDHSKRAITELNATIGVLRNGDAVTPRAPAPGVADLDRLTDTAARLGLHVDLSVIGSPRPLPATVDLTAYRIVQESLTNVVRHAHASSATVQVRYDADSLVVTVEDDGRGQQQATNGSGHGLIGMRERAAAVGGTLEAGPAPAGGFRVTARLPLGGGTA